VWHILEGQFQLLLVNAQHVKAIPGRKTDRRDSAWVAQLLQHGLLRGSFIPPRTDSGTARSDSLELIADLEFVESRMTRIEAEISRHLESSADTVERLCTVPGIDRVSAWGIMSEIGLDMSRFPDARHLASWAGLCPGNWESAGKQKSGRTSKGSAWLVGHFCQSVWGVSTKQNNYLSALFRRLAARRGVTRATMAVAHPLRVIAYQILKNHVEYQELGAAYFDRINPVRLTRHLARRLEGLGFQVMLEARPA